MFIIIVYLQNDVKRPTACYYYTPVARDSCNDVNEEPVITVNRWTN